MPVKTGAFKVGDDVTAVYAEDGHKYVAKITKVNDDGTCEVNFTEYDEKCIVKNEDIIADGGNHGRRETKTQVAELGLDPNKVLAEDTTASGEITALEMENPAKETKALKKAAAPRKTATAQGGGRMIGGYEFCLPKKDGENRIWVAALPPLLFGFSQTVYLSVAAGLFAFFFIILPVVLTLPETVSCFADDEKYFVVKIDPPRIDEIEPSMVCVNEGERTLTVRGNAFLDYNGNKPAVSIAGNAVPYRDFSTIERLAPGCAEVDVRKQDVFLCTSFETTIAMNSSLSAITYQSIKLVSHKPEAPHATASISDEPCFDEQQGLLTIVPPADIDDVSPPAICTGSSTPITISGRNFVRHTSNTTEISQYPFVKVLSTNYHFADSAMTLLDCTDFQANGYYDVAACDTIEVLVDGDRHAKNAALTIDLYNGYPLNCSALRQSQFAIVDPPSVTHATPAIVCNSGSNSEVTLHGNNFLVVDNVPPRVEVATALSYSGPIPVSSFADCTSIALPLSAHTVQTCKQLVLDVPQFASPVGLTEAAITVTPPLLGASACPRTFASTLFFAPDPQVSGADPSNICVGKQETTTSLKLSGPALANSFAAYDGYAGPLAVTGAMSVTQQDPSTIRVSYSLRGLEPSASGGIHIHVGSSCAVAAGVGGHLWAPNPGSPDPWLTTTWTSDATGAGSGAFSLVAGYSAHELKGRTAVIHDSTGTRVACSTIGTGEVFMFYESAKPAVTLGGISYALASFGTQSAPVAIQVDATTSASVRFSSDITIDVGTGAVDALPPGYQSIVVSQPAPISCSSTSDNTFNLVYPAKVTSIYPPAFCAGDENIITMKGESFGSGTEVTLTHTVNQDIITPKTKVVNSATEMVVTFEPDGMYSGTWDIAAVNPLAGCDIASGISVEVRPLLLLFYVDPPIMYNGVDLQVTIYSSGLNGDTGNITLIDTTGTRVRITDFSHLTPSKVQANIPRLLAAGLWDIELIRLDACGATLNAGLEIISQLSVVVDRVDPGFVYVNDAVAVDVFSVPTGSLPANFKNFLDPPIVYLSPSALQLGDKAISLRAVEYLSEEKLSGVIPPNILIPGKKYDVIVINPDKSVGLKSQAFTVTANPPVLVKSVTPNSIVSGLVRIEGVNFQSTSVVTVLCGVGFTNEITQTSSFVDANVINVPNMVGGGTGECLLRVQNADGQTATFSSIVFISNSANIATWSTQPGTLTPRRAAAGVIAEVTLKDPLMVVIGGDSGGPKGAAPTGTIFDTVETGRIQPDGSVPVFIEQSARLPVPLTYASAVTLGRYIYLIGGLTTGGVVSNKVYRSHIMSPLTTPALEISLDLITTNSSLVGGLWFYRVSAVFGPTDPINPSGESLPGELLNVRLPPLQLLDGNINMQLTVSWAAIDGAVGYNVYRTPKPDMTPKDVVLLAYVSTTYFIDIDTLPTNETKVPLKQGTLGNWATLSTNNLPGPRMKMGVSLAKDDPSRALPDKWFIYVSGGSSAFPAGSSAIRDIQHLTVAVTPQVGTTREKHTITSWAQSMTFLDDREGVRTLVATSVTNLGITDPTESWLYISSSRTTPTLTAGRINKATGQLAVRTEPGQPTRPDLIPVNHATEDGICFFIARELWGVQSTKTASGPFCGGSVTGNNCKTVPPDIQKITAGGGSTLSGDYSACITFRQFVYAVGGATTGNALTGIDQSYCCA